MPSSFGIRKHPCFCCKKEKTNFEEFSNDIESNTHAKIYDEKHPILIKNLTKKFGNFTAVDKLTYSIKEGEVFTVLGHNGAGKTTCINMLTGVLESNGGNAIMYGNSIKDNIDAV